MMSTTMITSMITIAPTFIGLNMTAPRLRESCQS
jgi:hypothetical protein